MLGTRGRCFGSFGVLTSTAGFCSTLCSFASHLNHDRIAASARAARRLASAPAHTSAPGRPGYADASRPRPPRPDPSVSVRNATKSCDLPPIRPHRMRRAVPLILQHTQRSPRHARSSPCRRSSSSPAPAALMPSPVKAAEPALGALARSPHLPPRMMLPMHPLQVLHRHMRIHLRRRNIRMPQQPLHAPQVRPMLHHVRRAAMPQHVRTRLRPRMIRPAAASRTISHTHCRVSGLPRTLRNSARCIPARTSCPPPAPQIRLHRLHRLAPQRHNPLLIALAPHLRPRLVQMQILHPQRSRSPPPAARPHTATPESRGPAEPAPRSPASRLRPQPSAPPLQPDPASPPPRSPPATSAAPSSSPASLSSPSDHARSAHPAASTDKNPRRHVSFRATDRAST